MSQALTTHGWPASESPRGPQDTEPRSVPSRVRIGDLVLDLRRLELRRDGRLVFLRRQPLRLLIYLVTHRERIVSKEELFEALWADSYVSESALSSAIRDLRRALGDDGTRQGWVQTRRGCGYRLVAPVEVEAESSEAQLVELGGDFPLVGREEELGRLEKAEALASANGFRAVNIEAAAGQGRTRLLDAFCARPGSALRVRVAFDDEWWAPPYAAAGAILRALESALGSERFDALAGREARLLATLMPELAAAPGDAQPDPGDVASALATLLVRASSQQPLTLILDDLHRADAETIHVMARTFPAIAPGRLLLVSSMRMGETSDVLDASIERAHPSGVVEAMRLGPLSEEEVDHLAELQLGGPLPEGARLAIRQRSGGNPTLALALLDAMRGEICFRDEDWIAAASEVEPPDAVQRAIHRGLRGLSGAARRLLTAASWPSYGFDTCTAFRVAGLSPTLGRVALHELQSYGIVRRNASEGRYRIAEGLVREALFTRLSGVRQRELRRAVAEAAAG